MAHAASVILTETQASMRLWVDVRVCFTYMPLWIDMCMRFVVHHLVAMLILIEMSGAHALTGQLLAISAT